MKPSHRSSSLLSRPWPLLLLLVVSPVLAADNWTPGTGWTLAWADEFSGNSVDPANWTFETGGGGWGNNELETYTASAAAVANGELVITADRNGSGGYTSARLITKGKQAWKYGKVAARLRLPRGQGIWPAFWMLGSNIDAVGWPKCGEIDILEMIGGGEDRDDSFYGTLHWDANGHAQTGTDRVELPDPQVLADDYHVFEIEWDSQNVIWKRDGVEFGRRSVDVTLWPTMSEFHADFFIILNLAVGGDWPGSPNGTTTWPQRMQVDWVRVYRAEALAAPTFSQHPASQSVVAGQGVTFTASASGNPAPTYQWRKDNVDIGGATGSSFSIGSTSVGDAGSYTVVASNSQGSATSNAATLSVDPGLVAPSFTVQPAGQSVTLGDALMLSATATGNPAPTYQWRKDNVDIGGATGSSYSLGSVQLSDTGSYTVVATNSQGSMTSNPATVTVARMVPAITWTMPAYLVDGAALGGTELGASANVPGTFVYDPPAGTVLPLGLHDLSVTFTPTDTNTYSSVTVSRSLAVAPARPATFDASGYLAHNPDVAAGIGDVLDKLDQAWRHYYFYGVLEGRTDGDFNVQAYMAQYPNAGATPQAAALYWYTTGRKNGDRIPAGFSVAGYFLRNSDIAAIFANDKYGAWLHYYNYGVFEGRSFDANFIVDEYLELNLDLKGAFGTNKQEALMHWLTWGHPVEDRMGRVPIGFNVDSYLARYPDLAAVFGDITPKAVRNVTVWHHYVEYGTLEGRTDGDFEAYNYLATNPDLAAVYGSDIRAAALHWFFYGRREGRRIPGGFDVQDYRVRYPDIVVGLGDDLYGAWLHYRDTGVYEGRVFGELFRPADYLALNPDVAAAIGNDYRDALLHWLYYGQFEGRQGRY